MLLRCNLNASTFCLFDQMWVQSTLVKKDGTDLIAQLKAQRGHNLLVMLYGGFLEG